MMKGFAALAMMAFFATAFAQDEVYEELNVVLQQLQVNVVDRDGNPIRNLQKGDIEIKLDGKVQKIQGIEEIDLQQLVSGSAQDGRELPEQARRLFVFFFDLRYTTKQGLIKARREALNFVKEDMLASDLGSVFTFDRTKGVKMLVNFTGDKGYLAKAMDTLGLADGLDTQRGPSGYFMTSLINNSANTSSEQPDGSTDTGTEDRGFGSMAGDFLQDVFKNARKTERKNYNREVNQFLVAIGRFAEGLSHIRGRKNMIWFSTGFDASGLIGASFDEIKENTDRTAFGEIWEVDSEQMGSGTVQNASTTAVAALQNSGTVVFAVDTSGADGLSSEKNGIQSLTMFATDTGGKVYTNRNDFGESLDLIKDVTNHYYLVSFYPETKGRDPKGKLKVKVKQSGAKVYTNRGINLSNEFGGMTAIDRKIQISEYIARDQVSVAVPLEMETSMLPAPEGLERLFTSVTIPGDYFVLPGFKKGQRNLEVFVLATNTETNRVFDQSYFQFGIDPAKLETTLAKTGVRYFANLYLEPGNYRLKVVARDLLSGKIGSIIQDVSIKTQEERLAGPFVMGDDKWVLVRQPDAMQKAVKGDGVDVSYPFGMAGQALVPGAASVSKDAQAKFMYLLNYRNGADDQLEPAVRLIFMDSAGGYVQIPPEAIRAETELKAGAPHMTAVLVTLDMSKIQIEEGSYKLMAMFALGDREPIKSMSDLRIASGTM